MLRVGKRVASLEKLHKSVKFSVPTEENVTLPDWKRTLDLQIKEMSVQLAKKTSIIEFEELERKLLASINRFQKEALQAPQTVNRFVL